MGRKPTFQHRGCLASALLKSPEWLREGGISTGQKGVPHLLAGQGQKRKAAALRKAGSGAAGNWRTGSGALPAAPKATALTLLINNHTTHWPHTEVIYSFMVCDLAYLDLTISILIKLTQN